MSRLPKSIERLVTIANNQISRTTRYYLKREEARQAFDEYLEIRAAFVDIEKQKNEFTKVS